LGEADRAVILELVHLDLDPSLGCWTDNLTL
jgi:hypothetical protein